MKTVQEKRKTFKTCGGIPVYYLGKEFNKTSDINLEAIAEGDGKNTSEIINVIKNAIHAIPELFNEVNLEHIEIYFGKTTLSRVSRRYKQHWNRDNTCYFLPLIKVSDKEIDQIEKLGLRYINFLMTNNHLCFGKLLNQNTVLSSRKSNEEKQVIYLTFRIDKRLKLKSPTDYEMNSAIEHLCYLMKNEFPKEASPEELKTILYTINKTGNEPNLYWY